MNAEDTILSLQLTVQKLTDELSLYRCGTTGTELLDLILEKDVEISTLKENLRKIAKGSTDVLSKYDSIQADCTHLSQRNKELEMAIASKDTNLSKKTEEIIKLNAEFMQVKSNMQVETERLVAQIIASEKRIEILSSQLNDAAEEISSKVKSLEKERCGRASQAKEFRIELGEARTLNAAITKCLQATQENTVSLTAKIKELQRELGDVKRLNATAEGTVDQLKKKHQDFVAVANQQIASLENELRTTLKSYQLLSEHVKKADHSHFQELKMKDDTIIELRQAITAAADEVAKSREQWQLETARRVASVNLELMNTKQQLDGNIERLKSIEAERERYTIHKREIDMLRAKVQEQEDKISRQEKYMKSRLLKDKTNIISTAAVQPPPTPPGALNVAPKAAPMSAPSRRLSMESPLSYSEGTSLAMTSSRATGYSGSYSGYGGHTGAYSSGHGGPHGGHGGHVHSAYSARYRREAFAPAPDLG